MTLSKKFGFGKEKRLVKNRQFKAALDKGERFSDSLLVIYAAPNQLPYSRLGPCASKKTGNAVVRNRLKRIIVEAFRLGQHQLPAGLDFVVMLNPKWLRQISREKSVKNAVHQLKSDQISKSLLKLAQRAADKID